MNAWELFQVLAEKLRAQEDLHFAPVLFLDVTGDLLPVTAAWHTDGTLIVREEAI